MKKLSDNFNLEEFKRSRTADKYRVDNTPPPKVVRAIAYLVCNLLQPLREAYGKPLVVNSGFRCERVNRLVGGAASSQHLKGEAADIACDDPQALVACLKQCGLPFDQCGVYKRFVHLSLKLDGEQRGVFYNGNY